MIEEALKNMEIGDKFDFGNSKHSTQVIRNKVSIFHKNNPEKRFTVIRVLNVIVRVK